MCWYISRASDAVAAPVFMLSFKLKAQKGFSLKENKENDGSSEPLAREIFVCIRVHS